MENVLPWLIWVAIIGGSIASSVSKAKKRREEEARRASHTERKIAQAATRQEAGSGSGAGRAKSVGGTFGRVLEELSRQLELDERPLPPVAYPTVFRPASQPDVQPEATSYDYYSLEGEYDATDGRGYREYNSAEEFDAEQRYVGGELRGTNSSSGSGSGSGRYQGGTVEVAANRMAASAGLATAANSADDGKGAGDGAGTTLQDLLGGDFDLRRAVIEAEILTPKYVAR